MYTNTKYIFLVFQNQRTTYYNDNGEKVSGQEMVKSHDHNNYTIGENGVPTSSVLFENFDIKQSFGETLDAATLDLLNQSGTTCTIQRVPDPANPGQQKGILTFQKKIWNGNLGEKRQIEIPPEKLFQNSYEFPNFDFSLRRNTLEGVYSIVDKNNKSTFEISTRNVDNFRREVYKISLDMMLEAYDLGDEQEGKATVDALIEKAQETGKVSVENIKKIKESLSSIEAHTLANTNKALKILLKELSDEGVSLPLRNKGVSEQSWWQPDDAPSFFGGVDIKNQDTIGLSNSVDFSRVYKYLQGTPNTYKGMNVYESEELNQVANFFINHFTLPNPDTK